MSEKRATYNARRTASDEEIFAACDAIYAKSHRIAAVTIDAVRTIVKGGSNSTLLPLITQWKQHQRAGVQLPPELTPYIQKLWSALQKSAGQEERAKANALANELAEFKQRFIEVTGTTERQLVLMRETIAAKEAETKALSVSNSELRAIRATLESDNARLKKENSEIQAQNRQLEKKNAEFSQTVDAQSQRLVESDAQLKRALVERQKDSEGMQAGIDRWMRECDTLRQEKKELAQLNKRLASERDELSASLHQLKLEHRGCTAKIEVLETTAAQLSGGKTASARAARAKKREQ